MEQLDSHWKNFNSFFENLSRKFKFDENLLRITGTLQEDVFTFVLTLRCILLRIRNVLCELCTEIYIFTNSWHHSFSEVHLLNVFRCFSTPSSGSSRHTGFFFVRCKHLTIHIFYRSCKLLKHLH
jgi:hypothetical protein